MELDQGSANYSLRAQSGPPIFLQIKFDWNTALLMCLGSIKTKGSLNLAHSHATKAEWSRQNRGCTDHKA